MKTESYIPGVIKYGCTIWKGSLIYFDNYVTGTSKNFGKLPAGTYKIVMRPYGKPFPYIFTIPIGPASDAVYFSVTVPTPPPVQKPIGNDGYPWNNSNCPMVGEVRAKGSAFMSAYDDKDVLKPAVPDYASTHGFDGNGHDGHGYGCRQCASYVAWRLWKETGFYPNGQTPDYWGNAWNFTAKAQAKFGASDGKPHAGSIAVKDATKSVPEGHVGWVESEPFKNAQGQTVINVSQYNNAACGYGNFCTIQMPVTAFDHYVQIKK